MRVCGQQARRGGEGAARAHTMRAHVRMQRMCIQGMRCMRGAPCRARACARAHPMMSLSTLSRSDSMTVILDDTLLPPTIAQKGFLGCDTAPSR